MYNITLWWQGWSFNGELFHQENFCYFETRDVFYPNFDEFLQRDNEHFWVSPFWCVHWCDDNWTEELHVVTKKLHQLPLFCKHNTWCRTVFRREWSFFLFYPAVCFSFPSTIVHRALLLLNEQENGFNNIQFLLFSFCLVHTLFYPMFIASRRIFNIFSFNFFVHRESCAWSFFTCWKRRIVLTIEIILHTQHRPN